MPQSLRDLKTGKIDPHSFPPRDNLSLEKNNGARALLELKKREKVM
jgi:hypothetical protein